MNKSDWEFIDDDQDQGIREPVQTAIATQEPNPISQENEPGFFQQGALSNFVQNQMQGAIYNKPNINFLKGTASGLTFGATEQIPGFEATGQGSELGKLAGSALPIHGLTKIFAAPLVQMAAKSPYFAKPLQAIGNLIGMGVTGAIHKDIENGVAGKPFDAQDIVEHGAQWMALDAVVQSLGYTGKFIKAMTGRIKATGQSPLEVLNSLSETVPDLSKRNISKLSNMTSSQQEQVLDSAINAIENPTKLGTGKQQPLDLKIDQQFFDRVEKQPELFTEPTRPNEFKFEEIQQEIPKNNPKYEKISPKAENEAKLGENIQKDIETEFKREQKVYNEKYDQVQEYVDNLKLTTKAEDSINFVKEMVTDLESVKTKPEGYKKVIDTLNDVLQDLGVTTGTNYHFKGFNLPNQPVSLSKLMELGRRLNKIAAYDIVGSSIKKKINTVARVVKNEIGQGLKQVSPELTEIWQTAEREFGSTAEKFGNETIMKIRGMELPETIARGLNFPSAVKQMKLVLSPKQFAQIERQILEKIDSLGFEAARKYYGEIAPQLSQQAKAFAKEAVRLKHPKSRVSQVDKIKTSVLDDLEASINSGKRPDRALKLMKTEKGRKLVRDSLKDRPDGPEVYDYLERQTLRDYSASFIREGKIDFTELNKFLQDKAFIANVRALGGEEAVRFIRQLEGMSKQFQKNMNLLKKLPETHTTKGKVKQSERGEHLLKKTSNKPLEARNEAGERGKAIQEKVLSKAKRKAGEEGYREAKTSATKESERGKELIQKIPKYEHPVKYHVEKFLEKFSPVTKTALSIIGASTLGLSKAASLASSAVFFKLLTNHKAHQAFRQAVANKTNPVAFLAALEAFDEAMKKSDDDEKKGKLEKVEQNKRVNKSPASDWEFVN